MADFRIHDVDEKEIDTILAEDIDFTGDLAFSKPLMIKGKFHGTVKATGDLHIGVHSQVEATVDARNVSLKGQITGDITAQNRVELYSSAVVDGDISSPEIVMESGCRFNGSCKMISEEEGTPIE